MDTSPEIDDDNLSYYQEMIRYIWWGIDLVRSKVTTEVALLSIELSLPRCGQIDIRFDVHSYFNNHPYYKLVINPAYMSFKNNFGKCFNKEAKWFGFYGGVKEEVPDNAP